MHPSQYSLTGQNRGLKHHSFHVIRICYWYDPCPVLANPERQTDRVRKHEREGGEREGEREKERESIIQALTFDVAVESWKDTIRQFGEETTLHGVRYIAQTSRYKSRRYVMNAQ